jgi:hypothetical protein
MILLYLDEMQVSIQTIFCLGTLSANGRPLKTYTRGPCELSYSKIVRYLDVNRNGNYRTEWGIALI